MSRIFTLFLIVLAFFGTARAQLVSGMLDTVRNRLEKNIGTQKQEGLYLHLDKTIYVHNEHIWFTGYVLSPEKYLHQHHTLYVLLADQLSGKIVYNERYILSDGIGKGQIMVADSLMPGEYQLIAYSNTFLQNQEEPVFMQSISIRNGYRDDVTVVIDSFQTNLPGAITIIPRVTSGKWGLAAGGQLRYTLYSDQRKLISGREKIDASGNARILLADSLAHGKLEIRGEITFKKEVYPFRKLLQLPVTQVHVRFFAEGGQLVDGHLTRVAYEISAEGQAMSVTGKLLQNGVPVAPLRSDRYGLGSVNFIPELSAKYSVILDLPGEHIFNLSFPKVEPNGFTLMVKNPVAPDTLHVTIQPPAPDTECVVLLHNYRQEFFSAGILIKGGKGLLKIPVSDLPDGVATLTVFDKNSKPVAERAVLLKRPDPVNVFMSTDSSNYLKRSRVTIKIRVSDTSDLPVAAAFSLASVYAARLDSLRFADITRFYIYDRHLPVQGVLPPPGFFSEESNVDHLLLTRYWTRYKWVDWLNKPDTKNYSGEAGHVLFRRKKVKQPVDLIVLGHQNVMQIATDSTGGFSLLAEMLYGPPDTKLLVSVLDKTKSPDYDLFIQNDLDSLNAGLVRRPFHHSSLEPDELAEAERNDKTLLQGVVVTASRPIESQGTYKSPHCNDYVCIYNILNCTNHPMSGSRPVSGGSYLWRGNSGNLQRITYISCDKDRARESGFLKQVKATYGAKEFYKSDYITYNPEEREAFSTIFWAHQIETDRNGEAEVSFFTNDLTGTFVCILQGMSNGLPVSGRVSFRVR